MRTGRISGKELQALYDLAVRDTSRRFEETGSPVITDGEQAKPSFVTYPIHGLKNLAPDGVVIPFADGHTPAAAPIDGRAFLLRDLRRPVSGGGQEGRPGPGQTGRYLCLGVEPAVARPATLQAQ